jgi:hypothetical protein
LAASDEIQQRSSRTDERRGESDDQPDQRGPASCKSAKVPLVNSAQTLALAERRVVATWAAVCAERVLPLFEAEDPADGRPRDAIARTRAFACGELDTAAAIRRRFEGGDAARGVSASAAAAARAAGQAAAICHMGAHAFGAAAYAVKAAALAAPDRPEVVDVEIEWQLRRASADVRAALRAVPAVGEDRTGPLGPGLLASGLLGLVIRRLQVGLASTGTPAVPDESCLPR